MKYFCFMVVILACCGRVYAQKSDKRKSLFSGLTGPAYAAAKSKQLNKLQERNAAARPAQHLSGPAYSFARARWLRGVQISNYRNRRVAPVGPVYALQVANIKARQRFFNGTWRNNTYFYSSRRRIRTGTRNTPAFRPLNDPWMWYSQQSFGYRQWRY